MASTNEQIIVFSDEYTLRWDDSFYAAGVFIAISGVLAWVTGYLEDLDEQKEQNQANADSYSTSMQNNRKN